MAFAIDYRRSAAALAAFVLTSVLFWFGNDLDPWWPLLWFAPLPVLLFALRSSWWGAALLAGLSVLAGSLSMWHYFRVLHAPFWVWAAVYSIAALVFVAAVLLFRALLRRGAFWSALLAFPAAWVTYEYARNLLTPHGTAGSFAYSQLDFLPFLQLASITGPWGMSFLLFLFPAALAVGVHLHPTAPKQAWRVVGAGLGVLVLVLIFGAVRLALPAPPGQEVTVGLLSSDEAANGGVVEGVEAERLFRDYAREAEKLAARGAQVIVLPEKLAAIVDPDTKSSDAIFQSLADKIKATIVVGVVYVALPTKYNEARVYAPGAPMLRYDKHHMLPPFESNLQPGTTLTLMPGRSQTWGVAICKDMDFTQLSREYGEAGAGLMLAPAWDFNVDRGWHGHIAVMRGVESGFSVVRAARNGYLTVSDNRGKILAETRSDSAPFAALMAQAPAIHDRTLYVLFGDWFAWLSIGILAFTLTRIFAKAD